jgi:hypothetical protein
VVEDRPKTLVAPSKCDSVRGRTGYVGRCGTFRGAVSHERRHVRISDMRRDGYATSSQENVVARTLGSFALFS